MNRVGEKAKGGAHARAASAQCSRHATDRRKPPPHAARCVRLPVSLPLSICQLARPSWRCLPHLACCEDERHVSEGLHAALFEGHEGVREHLRPGRGPHGQAVRGPGPEPLGQALRFLEGTEGAGVRIGPIRGRLRERGEGLL